MYIHIALQLNYTMEDSLMPGRVEFRFSPQPKYIHALKKAAERRKLEGELVYEHLAQKEIEKDAEQFKDKESFVTSAYKKKLVERRKLEEELAREAVIEGGPPAELHT